MQKGRYLLEEYPRVGEVRMGSGTQVDAWSLDKQCILSSGSSMQATESATSEHYICLSWKYIGHCGSFTVEKSSLGNIHIQIFLSVNIAKLNLLPIIGGILRESYTLKVVSWIWVWNEEIKPELISNFTIHNRSLHFFLTVWSQPWEIDSHTVSAPSLKPLTSQRIWFVF